MSMCACPGCSETDSNDETTLRFEYAESEGIWMPVCDRHVDRDNPNVPLTDEVKETPVGALTTVVDAVGE
jgi:hypothetical protein